jgi:hypothetical protein
MSWFRFSALFGVICGSAFIFFPHLSNVILGINYSGSLHAEDWTRLLGLAIYGLSFIMNAAHISQSMEFKQSAARGMLIFSLPCAIISTYWQIIPDGRWNRLDIINIFLLFLMSYGLLMNSGLFKKDKATSPTI